VGAHFYQGGEQWGAEVQGLGFEVGENCPYNNKEQGYAEARLFKKKTTIEIEGPDGMFTKQEN